MHDSKAENLVDILKEKVLAGYNISREEALALAAADLAALYREID